INLKIIAPNFAGAVKHWTKIDGARFGRNVGNDFDWLPIRCAADWAIGHRIAGEDMSIGIDDSERCARPIRDVFGFDPTGTPNAFPQQDGIFGNVVASVARRLKWPAAAAAD